MPTRLAPLCLLAFLVVVPAQASAASWKTFRGHRYRLTPTPSDWRAAESYATRLGGHLVAINDAEEQEWLIEAFGDERIFWIGCTDEKTEGRWRWTSGEPFGFSNWYGGEPDDLNSGEDYGIINFGSRGKWNDVGPDSTEWGFYRGIVEVSPDKPTEVPGGLVAVDTRDGARCLGRLPVESVRVRTSYGVLTVPLDELREIWFRAARGEEPGAAGKSRDGSCTSSALAKDRIVTARFTAVGIAELQAVELHTKYGRMRFERSDLRRIVLGEPARSGRRVARREPPAFR